MPLLILIDDEDGVTPAAPCIAMVDSAREKGEPVKVKVRPGIGHAFDLDIMPFLHAPNS